jgi:hypothetical protein
LSGDALPGRTARWARRSEILWALALLFTPALSAQVTAPPPPAGMFRQYAPGLLARINYQADTAGAYRVAIWDLLVGPGKRMAGPVSLPGGAVLEVRSGTGRVEIDGVARELRGGVTFVVHQGSRFALANGQDETALALRATVIGARAP